MRSLTLAFFLVALWAHVRGQASVVIQYLEIPQFRNEIIVYPRFILTPDGRRLLQVTDDFNLNLDPTNVFPPQILVRTFDSLGNPIDENMDTKDISDGIYFDPKNGASIQMNKPKVVGGLPEFVGVLSNGLRIVPVTGRNSRNGAMPHRVFRYKDRQSHEHDFVLPLNLSIFNPFGTSGVYPGLETAPFKIRPEVMMVSDTAHSSKFSSKTELLRYIGTFMNAVNLRYRSVSGMDLQLKLAGVVINNVENEPYVRGYGGHVIADQTLAGFAQYINSGGIPSEFDLAYLMTGRDMAAVDPFYGLHPGVAGLAYVGGACTPQRTGMGEDLAGSYDGVHVAAHEIAHLLGCVHDGDPAPFYLSGSPGARECPWDHGFIMSYKDGGSNRYKFSQCCVNSMKYLVRNPGHHCLRHEATLPDPVPSAPIKPVAPIPLDTPASNTRSVNSLTLPQSPTRISSFLPSVPEFPSTFHFPGLNSIQKPQTPALRIDRSLLLNNNLPGEKVSPSQYCKQKYPQIKNVWSDGSISELGKCKIRCAYPPRSDGLYLYHVTNALDGTSCGSGRRCINGACI
ncbi:venom metalloproteinase antarease-like TtrivMP_A [Galendromus occidentalis]|uniref:Venom metalloproteinase antarease-like TtrivMP_A n=1 Tax=Galendromus occidentalis TaxID=34638 RepID=A0AAJ7P9C8_9ACAR|nr:venom metalloproteinase antarease-like TtrivMP_A [Galendromus occidentalis]